MIAIPGILLLLIALLGLIWQGGSKKSSNSAIEKLENRKVPNAETANLGLSAPPKWTEVESDSRFSALDPAGKILVAIVWDQDRQAYLSHLRAQATAASNFADIYEVLSPEWKKYYAKSRSFDKEADLWNNESVVDTIKNYHKKLPALNSYGIRKYLDGSLSSFSPAAIRQSIETLNTNSPRVGTEGAVENISAGLGKTCVILWREFKRLDTKEIIDAWRPGFMKKWEGRTYIDDGLLEMNVTTHIEVFDIDGRHMMRFVVSPEMAKSKRLKSREEIRRSSEEFAAWRARFEQQRAREENARQDREARDLAEKALKIKKDAIRQQASDLENQTRQIAQEIKEAADRQRQADQERFAEATRQQQEALEVQKKQIRTLESGNSELDALRSISMEQEKLLKNQEKELQRQTEILRNIELEKESNSLNNR